MMRCRWLAVILFSALLSGCNLVKGTSPYAARPTCPPPGAMSDSDKKTTTQEMKGTEILTEDEDCFYMLQITAIDEKAGRASGKVPLDQVQRMVKSSDGIEWSNLTRRMTPIENYPRFEYSFQVEGGTAGLTKGNVAHFVRKAGSNALTYLPRDQTCAMKESMIRAHAKKCGYKPYTIEEEYIEECPNLKHMSWEEKN